MNYRLIINPEYIDVPGIRDTLQGNHAKIVNDGYIKRNEISNLIKAGAVKIIPVLQEMETPASNENFRKQRKRLVDLENEENINSNPDLEEKEGVN